MLSLFGSGFVHEMVLSCTQPTLFLLCLSDWIQVHSLQFAVYLRGGSFEVTCT